MSETDTVQFFCWTRNRHHCGGTSSSRSPKARAMWVCTLLYDAKLPVMVAPHRAIGRRYRHHKRKEPDRLVPGLNACASCAITDQPPLTP